MDRSDIDTAEMDLINVCADANEATDSYKPVKMGLFNWKLMFSKGWREIFMWLSSATLILSILAPFSMKRCRRSLWCHKSRSLFKHGCVLCTHTDGDADSPSVTDLLWCTVSRLPRRYDLDCKSDNLSKHVSDPFISAVQQSVTHSRERCTFIPVQYLPATNTHFILTRWRNVWLEFCLSSTFVVGIKAQNQIRL